MKTKQQRMEAQMDELLRCCDALAARLTAFTLLDATFHQILAAGRQ